MPISTTHPLSATTPCEQLWTPLGGWRFQWTRVGRPPLGWVVVPQASLSRSRTSVRPGPRCSKQVSARGSSYTRLGGSGAKKRIWSLGGIAIAALIAAAAVGKALVDDSPPRRPSLTLPVIDATSAASSLFRMAVVAVRRERLHHYGGGHHLRVERRKPSSTHALACRDWHSSLDDAADD
jgi:hypothetical protein